MGDRPSLVYGIKGGTSLFSLFQGYILAVRGRIDTLVGESREKWVSKPSMPSP